MEDNVKYFIGYEVDGEIIKIEVELTPEFQSCSISPNRLKNIDFFTQTFDHKTFLDFLRARRLINVLEEVKLFKKDINPDTGVEEIIELRGGFAFSDSIPYFKSDKIKKYFNDHIPNLEFLIAANDFLKRYFGLKKPMPEGLSHFEREEFLRDNTSALYSSYNELFLYLEFLKKKKNYDPKRENLRLRQNQKATENTCIGSCRAALTKMLKEILNDESEGNTLNYEGLHDLALFVYNFELQHHLEKEAYVTHDRISTNKSVGYAQSDEYNDTQRLF